MRGAPGARQARSPAPSTAGDAQGPMQGPQKNAAFKIAGKTTWKKGATTMLNKLINFIKDNGFIFVSGSSSPSALSSLLNHKDSE